MSRKYFINSKIHIFTLNYVKSKTTIVKLAIFFSLQVANKVCLTVGCILDSMKNSITEFKLKKVKFQVITKENQSKVQKL